MRWLIVGPYAPERSRGAQLATSAAVERLDAGDAVQVISPRPSAAHQHRPLSGEKALHALHGEIGPRDGLWIRIEPGVALTVGPPRMRAIAERILLARLLRRAARSVVDVGDVSLFPGGRAGSLVFRAADTFVVHAEPERAALLAAGCPAAKLTLVPTSVPARTDGQPPEASQPGDVRKDVPAADFSDLAGAGSKADIERAVKTRVAQISQAP